MIEELAVELFPLVDDDSQGVFLFDELSAARAHELALIGTHGHDCRHGLGQGGDIAYWNYPTSLAWNHGFSGACAIGGDDGKSVGRCFKNAYREAFPERGEYEGFGVGEEWLDVALEACEVGAVRDLEFCGESFEAGLFRA